MITPDMPGLEGLRARRRSARRSTRRPGSRTRTRRTASRPRTTTLATDQFGTQLDPPAHWAPEYPGDRRAAGDLRRPPAGRDLDRRRRCKQGPEVHAAGRPTSSACEKQHGRIPAGSVVMVRSDWSKKWTTTRQGQGARGRPGLPRRLAGRAEVPAPQAPHPVPRPRAAGHRHDADARGRVVADAPRLHAGRGRGQPRQGARDRAASSTSATRSSRAASAATPATSRSARRTDRRARASRRATRRCRGTQARCTGTRSSATASAEHRPRRGAPAPRLAGVFGSISSHESAAQSVTRK